MPRWGMVLDLDRCIGCYSCTVACHVENGAPPGIWYAPVYEKQVGMFPDARRVFLPTLCMHCNEPACVKACPTKAISRREDGIVLVDQDVCCGTRACMIACPYGAMHFYGGEHGDYGDQLTPFEQSFKEKFQVGTVQKCTLCVHRIDRGILTPACVETCPTGARIFGDLSDPHSAVSKLSDIHHGFVLRPEAGTFPSIQYVMPKLRPARLQVDGGDISSGVQRQASAGGVPANALFFGEAPTHSSNDMTTRLEVEAKPQTVRGFSAAVWYVFTGVGGALYLNQLLFGIDMGRIAGLPMANLLGIILVGISALLLMRDLGRPARFVRALRNFGSSWISRGAIADVVFLFFGGLLLLSDLTIGGRPLLAALPWGSGSALHPILTWSVGAAALFMVLYPGIELSSSRAIPFWNTTLVPLQFLGSAFATAAGLTYVVSLRAPTGAVAVVALASLMATLAFSFVHIESARSQPGAARISADMLVKGSLAPYFLWGNLVLGLMVPGLILAAELVRELPAGLLALAGVLLLAANFLAKRTLLKAGYYGPLL